MNHNRHMTARALAFLIWAVAAMCAMFWALRMFIAAPLVPSYATPADTQRGARGDLSKLLGREVVVANTPQAAPEAASRFHLVGVVAPKGAAAASALGLALLSVDNKPARHYRVGTPVDGDVWLLSVGTRTAALGPRQGPASFSVALPPPAAAATGVLPGMPGGMSVAPAPLPVRPVLPAVAQPAEPARTPMPGTIDPNTIPTPPGEPPPGQTHDPTR
jgi:general secretion pathway protein C